MPRALTKDAPPRPTGRAKGCEEKTFEISLVTPMFGGGVKPGAIDPLTPIRATSIRGHLRFWWRATCGARYADPRELFVREGEIWGTTERASRVSVSVDARRCREWRKTRSSGDHYGFQKYGAETYALFSAQQNGNVLCREGMTFPLTVTYPEELEDDVTTSLRAWVNFGGVGARTRRGCGSLWCDGLSMVNDGLKTFCRQANIVILLGPSCNDGLSAWKKSVEIYRFFRQDQRMSPHKKTILDKKKKEEKVIQVPGRSHWPEPDSIRKLTGCSLKPSSAHSLSKVHDHTRPVVEEKFINTFPRAVLGLPIIFHFADAPEKNKNDQTTCHADFDPVDCRLVPRRQNAKGEIEDGSRMASPVITKPLWVGRWHPSIIVMPTAQALDVECSLLGDGTQGEIREHIPNRRIQGDFLKKLRPMREKTDAISAFLAFATESGYEEVRP